MRKKLSNENRIDASKEVGQRYQSAKKIIQGFFNEDLVKNATVFSNWIESSDCFWYRRTIKGGREFRLVDANSGSNRLAFDHQALARLLADATGNDTNPNNLPIASDIAISLSPLELKFSAFDKRWLYEAEKNLCQTITADQSGAWVISPDGQHAVLGRDNNLWLRDLNSGKETPLTNDGQECFVYGAIGSVWGSELEKGLQAR